LKEINVSNIIPVVKKLCIEANLYVSEDVITKVNEFLPSEDSPTAREIMSLMLVNYEMAVAERMPICQDTGVAVVFVELGQDVHLAGEDFYEAIQEGVRQGYRDGYLRKSMVNDPIIKRKNTRDNTPALIYTDIVPGKTLKITVAPKGGGSENMSMVKMMKAADGIEGVKDFVVNRIKEAGGNPCPPVIVGIGLGGNFEQSALLAKKALLRPITQAHPEPEWAAVEQDILERINRLGIGPQGLGGRTTALGVNILYKACHIASMPVAVNVQCHCHRHRSAIIQ